MLGFPNEKDLENTGLRVGTYKKRTSYLAIFFNFFIGLSLLALLWRGFYTKPIQPVIHSKTCGYHQQSHFDATEDGEWQFMAFGTRIFAFLLYHTSGDEGLPCTNLTFDALKVDFRGAGEWTLCIWEGQGACDTKSDFQFQNSNFSCVNSGRAGSFSVIPSDVECFLG